MLSSKKFNKELVSSSRKKGSRKKGNRRRGGRMQVYGAAYNQMKKDISWLMGIINVESKYIDTTLGGTLTNAWVLNLLNGCATGNTSTTRNGQSVKINGIELRWAASIAAAGGTCSVRFFLALDKQCNGAAFLGTDVYPATILGPRVVANIDRFVILHEEVFVLNQNSQQSVISSWFSKATFHVDFNTGNTGTITDITTNSLYFVALCDQTVNQPSLSAAIRVLFIDN